METCLRLRNLIKTFEAPHGDVRAVDGIDLDIGTGEVVALLGPNGAGKTTTLDLLLGYTIPTSGDVAVFGGDPRAAIHDGRISAVLQTGGLLRDLKVRETVELIASTHRDPMGVDEVIERAGISGIAEQFVQDCSGGEQQRLRFALALLPEPDLLVLDEPTTGMDVAARRDFWAAMHAEAEAGRTIVFATHYLQEAEDFAERTVLMASGRIVADGPTAEVRRRASGRVVRASFTIDRLDHVTDALRATCGVRSVAVDGSRLEIEAADADAVARLILGPLGGHDIEVAPASLETAFLQLTNNDQTAPAAV